MVSPKFLSVVSLTNEQTFSISNKVNRLFSNILKEDLDKRLLNISFAAKSMAYENKNSAHSACHFFLFHIFFPR